MEYIVNFLKRSWIVSCLIAGLEVGGLVTTRADAPESDITLDGEIVVTPNPVLAGQEIVVRYKIKNQGAGPTSAGFTTRVLLKNQYEFQFVANDYPVPALAAGQVSSQEHHIKLADDLFSGTYSVRLRLDPFLDLETEAERSNDASDPFPFSVVAVLPDIKVQFAEVCPHSAHAGDPVQLKFTVVNDSSSPTPVGRNRVELTDPKTDEQVFSQYLTNGVIAAHATADYVFPFTVPATGLPGNWSVSLFLNDFQDFAEADTFNDVNDPLVTLQVVGAEVAVEPCSEPLRLANPRWTGAKLAFDVTGDNSTVTIQGSKDLKTWSSIGPVTISGGQGSFTVPTGELSFFRAMK